MYPWVQGFDMTAVSISDVDRAAGSPKEGDHIAVNAANANDRWLVSKAYLEMHYTDVTNGVTFGHAKEAIAAGKRAARAGWNGKNMFIFQRPADELTPAFIVDKVKSLPQSVKNFIAKKYGQETHYAGGEEITIKFGSYLCLYAADGSIVNGWLPSQTDMSATDWCILD